MRDAMPWAWILARPSAKQRATQLTGLAGGSAKHSKSWFLRSSAQVSPQGAVQAASSPAAAKGFVARTAEAVATGAGTAAGAATIAYRLVGGAAVGVWRGAAILAGRGCQAATPAAAGGSTCLSWVADALTRRQQACSQAAADLLGSCPRDFWAAGEAVVLGAVGAAVGAAVGVAAAPFRRADAVLKAAGAACRRLLSRVGLAGRQ